MEAAAPDHAADPRLVTATQKGKPKPSKPPQRFTLRHGGHDLLLDVHEKGWSKEARLSIDGTAIGTATTKKPRDAPKDQGDRKARRIATPFGEVEVAFGVLDQVNGVVLLVADPASADGGVVEVPFEAPPGSWAHKVERFGQRHPRAFAARHAVIPVVQGLLGIAAAAFVLYVVLPWLGWFDGEPGGGDDGPLPEWARAVLKYRKLGLSVLAGAAVGWREHKRRKGRRRTVHPA